jgi:DNA polymerase-3 subunit epsilon
VLATASEPEEGNATDYGVLWKWQRLRKHPCTSHRSLAAAWARSVLEAHQDWLFVDTETTGLSSRDQVIELAVAAPVRQLGRWRLEPVLVQRMRPSVPINPSASMVHGITERHLRDAPTFVEIADQIRALMHGRRLLAWNAPFDRAALNKTSTFWQTSPVAQDHAWHCAMRAHAVWAGDTTGRMLYRYHKLGGDHSAMGDVMCMLDRIVAMAECEA